MRRVREVWQRWRLLSRMEHLGCRDEENLGLGFSYSVFLLAVNAQSLKHDVFGRRLKHSRV